MKKLNELSGFFMFMVYILLLPLLQVFLTLTLDSVGLRWTPSDSVGLRRSLSDSVGLRWTPLDLTGLDDKIEQICPVLGRVRVKK